MSKLVLDFDLSSQRRRPKNRIGGGSQQTECKVAPKKVARKLFTQKSSAEKLVFEESPPQPKRSKALDEKTEVSNPQSWCRWVRKNQQNAVPFLGLLIVVLVLCVSCFFFLGSSTHSKKVSRDLLVHSQCITQGTYIVCHAEACNLKGACHATSKNIVFGSMECADAVRTVAIHQSDGSVEHFPAHYLRVFNTATFAIDGRRALFSPVLPTCHASSWPTKASKVSNIVSKRLRGSIVWVAARKYKRFDVYRNDHLVAIMEESMVLVKRVGPSHYVYRFELVCRHWQNEEGPLSVFGQNDNFDEDTDKRKEVKSFNYCK